MIASDPLREGQPAPLHQVGLGLEWLNAAFYASAASGKQISIEDALPELAVFWKNSFQGELVRNGNGEVQTKGQSGYETQP